ncbi:MAG: LegC family aminotransferase [Phycisphaeraceae bacterium]
MTQPRMCDLELRPILDAVNQVLHEVNRPVPLHIPTLKGNAWDYVKECIDTGWVSSVGAYVDRFEQMAAAYTGAKHAVAVVNGTSALHMALLLAGVKRDDEVLSPSLTFVATANAISYCAAVPHFVDVDEQTMGIDPDRLDAYLAEAAELRADGCYNRTTGRRIAAMVPMHAFGHPCRLDPLLELCQRWRLTMVEDAAESLGSLYRDRHTGTFGKLGILSFNGNKIITTGGGGIILTDDEALAKQAKHLTTTAKQPHRWEYNHDQVGYNYRLPNLNAALGCAQFELLPSYVEAKRRLAARYIDAFADVPGVTFLAEPPETRSNYWLNTLVLAPEHASARDDLLSALHEAGMLVRPAWTPMHQLPMYRHCPHAELSVTESLAGRALNLPSSPHLAGEPAS